VARGAEGTDRVIASVPGWLPRHSIRVLDFQVADRSSRFQHTAAHHGFRRGICEPVPKYDEVCITLICLGPRRGSTLAPALSEKHCERVFINLSNVSEFLFQ
jgi:hypothetical protein